MSNWKLPASYALFTGLSPYLLQLVMDVPNVGIYASWCAASSLITYYLFSGSDQTAAINAYVVLGSSISVVIFAMMRKMPNSFVFSLAGTDVALAMIAPTFANLILGPF